MEATETNYVKAGPLMEQGYGVVSKKAMKDPSLSVEAKVVYAYVSSFEGGAEVCVLENLKEDLGMPDEVFRKAWAELLGYLESNDVRVVVNPGEPR